MVTNGKVFRKSKIRLIREGVVITSGTLESLKRFKDDVKEVSKGYDCGIQIKNYNDITIGDIVEADWPLPFSIACARDTNMPKYMERCH